MPTIIEEVSAQVVEPPPAPAADAGGGGRPPPDMARIQAELRREIERARRLWSD